MFSEQGLVDVIQFCRFARWAATRIETLDESFDAGPDAFLDTAAVMENLDLVVSCDTSLAHLAGALGRPTWLALKHVAEWRWLHDRADSPWYPSFRLFRQSAPEDWGSVFADMAEALRSLQPWQASTPKPPQ